MMQSVIFTAVLLFTISETNASSCHGNGNTLGGGHSKQQTIGKTNKQIYVLKFQTVCPITKNTVNRTIHTDWEGDEKNTSKRIYLCCAECIKKFNKKPAKYVIELLKTGQHLENYFQIGK